MNVQIKQLAEQAGLKVESWMTNPPKPFQILGSTEQFEKFAELLVLECMDQVWYTREDGINGNISEVIKERIKQHFGVDTQTE
jgi:hypothetical protein